MAITATDHDVPVAVSSPPLEIVGRVLYGAPFAVFGAMHMAAGPAMAAAVPDWVPGGGAFWVYATGLAMLAASLSVVTNLVTRISGILLAILLGTYILALHLPGYLAGEEMELQSVLKNTALMGGALLVAARGR